MGRRLSFPQCGDASLYAPNVRAHRRVALKLFQCACDSPSGLLVFARRNPGKFPHNYQRSSYVFSWIVATAPSIWRCVEQCVGQNATLQKRTQNVQCVTGCHSGPLSAVRMSFSLWTMDCRGIRGEGNRVVTTRRCSSQAVLGPKNRAFPALRAKGLPPNCADQGHWQIAKLAARAVIRNRVFGVFTAAL
jgi:hypothetical protein